MPEKAAPAAGTDQSAYKIARSSDFWSYGEDNHMRYEAIDHFLPSISHAATDASPSAFTGINPFQGVPVFTYLIGFIFYMVSIALLRPFALALLAFSSVS